MYGDGVDPESVLLRFSLVLRLSVALRFAGGFQPADDPLDLAAQAIEFRVVHFDDFQALLPRPPPDADLFLVIVTGIGVHRLITDVDEDLIRREGWPAWIIRGHSISPFGASREGGRKESSLTLGTLTTRACDGGWHLGSVESKLLPGCTARIDIDGAQCGTGFFVTAKDLITCRHVVRDAVTIEVRDRYGGRHPVRAVPVTGDESDVAWIKLDEPVPAVPVALLGEIADVGGELYSFGYPENNPGEPATFEVEGLTGDVPPRIKFKDGQVKPGTSGSPLLNMQTGAVCAVLVTTRGKQSSLGGYGVPLATMLSAPGFRELGTLNTAARAADRRWATALTADQEKLSADDPRAKASFTTQVSGDARVGKIVNIGDVSGPVTF